jgi:transposase
MFVGMDVHKDSIDISLAEDGRDGEVRRYGVIPGDLEAVTKVLRALRAPNRQLRFVYEAGPCGFGIHRYLTAQGEDCVVVNPSSMPKRSGDRIKTDRRDGDALARLHRAGELTPIYIPTPDDEALRDLVRAREDAVGLSTQAKHRLKAFLLRQGRRYPGRAGWTRAYRRWLADLSFPLAPQHIALQEYRDTIEETERRVERLTGQLRQLTPAWRWAPVVDALQALRGVSFVTAVGLVVEVGDIRRFDHPRQLMAFLGLVPSEYSSGPRVNASAARIELRRTRSSRFDAGRNLSV